MTRALAEGAVRELPHARPDHGSIASPGSTSYTVEDGSHVIEVEVVDSPVRVSCRFTLCHPPSVDAAFLNLVRELQRRLGMEARICDDVLPEHSQGFPPARFSEFAGVVPAYIARRRADWVAQFGTVHLAAKTPDVYEKVILPRCVPAAG
ncbi:MAG: hypothetical protein ACRC33_06335 [Gemmataceae bacterium]